MSGGLRSHVCVDSCPDRYVSWMYQLRTPSAVICRGWCLPIFRACGAPSKTAFYVPTRVLMCVRTSRDPDAQHPTRTLLAAAPRARSSRVPVLSVSSPPEARLRGGWGRSVGSRISRHAQSRTALRPQRGGFVGPCQHPLRKPLKTARKELPTPASWGKEGEPGASPAARPRPTSPF